MSVPAPVCPYCGADRERLRRVLESGPGRTGVQVSLDSYREALKTLNTCPYCERALCTSA